LPVDAGLQISPPGSLSSAAVLRFILVVLTEGFIAGHPADDFALT
jgi:hypothetical protein